MRGDVSVTRMPNLEDYPDDFKGYNAALIDEFRNNGGHVTGMF
jgi:hypothetical protein